MTGKPTAVFIEDGSDFDSTGDEFRSWYVYAGDDDGEPCGFELYGALCKGVSFSSFSGALHYAEALAGKLGGIEVVTG